MHLDINPWLYANGHAQVAQRRRLVPYSSFEDLHGAENNIISHAFGPHLQGGAETRFDSVITYCLD